MNEMGEPQKAIDYASQALRFDPRNPNIYVASTAAGFGNFLLGHHEMAIEWLTKAVAENSPEPGLRAGLAMAYAQIGDDARMRAATAELKHLRPKYTVSAAFAPKPGQPAAYRELYEKIILPAARKAKLPE